MKKTARILYFIVPMMFIFIGILHLKVHYQELVTPAIESTLNYDIPLMGKASNVWRMWQGFSFMMGVCFVIIGLLNLAMMAQVPKSAYPPKSMTAIMFLLMATVTYTGIHFFEAMQFYGGIFGMLILGIVLVLSFVGKD